ncbi:MAG: TlpA family protein disulfide reductase [Propionibacteriaceae bacterium]|nr:TlpA family protein disulfide reductase [Propionibacteriaceae bacterium]
MMVLNQRVFLATLMLVLLTGCTTTGADEPTRTAGQNGYVGGQKSLTQLAPAARQQAPVASGAALGSGRTVSTADYLGKVVVLNVWGSWCAPCREEADDLQQASVETARTEQFIGINSRDTDPAPAEAFVRAFQITYPSIYDASGKVLLNFAGNLPLSAFPSTLIIDPQGRVAVRITGPISKITLVDLINDVAAGK